METSGEYQQISQQLGEIRAALARLEAAFADVAQQPPARSLPNVEGLDAAPAAESVVDADPVMDRAVLQILRTSGVPMHTGQIVDRMQHSGWPNAVVMSVGPVIRRLRSDGHIVAKQSGMFTVREHSPRD